VLLVFGAPCQLQSLAGQEHGRTIPLTDLVLDGFAATQSARLTCWSTAFRLVPFTVDQVSDFAANILNAVVAARRRSSAMSSCNEARLSFFNFLSPCYILPENFSERSANGAKARALPRWACGESSPPGSRCNPTPRDSEMERAMIARKMEKFQ
jgi:hypothetical protein